MPRFSPDGKWIAFTASYQGNEDVYVIPAGGGGARRLTFHSDIVPKAPTRWARAIWYSPGRRTRKKSFIWAATSPGTPGTGGLPTPMPLDRAGLMSFGPDGHSIAYTGIFRDFRTWKHYNGGLAQDVYTYDFDAKKLTQITHFVGTDMAPMWGARSISSPIATKTGAPISGCTLAAGIRGVGDGFAVRRPGRMVLVRAVSG